MTDIIHRIGIKAPRSKVYAALATIPGISGWWTQETSGNAVPGGTVQVRFSTHSGERAQMEFELAQLKPGQEVVWRFTAGPPEWIGTDVTFNLTQEGEMTIVSFGHRNWREPIEFMAHCSMKWATFLLSLRQLVETGSGRPAPDDLKIDNWN